MFVLEILHCFLQAVHAQSSFRNKWYNETHTFRGNFESEFDCSRVEEIAPNRKKNENLTKLHLKVHFIKQCWRKLKLKLPFFHIHPCILPSTKIFLTFWQGTNQDNFRITPSEVISHSVVAKQSIALHQHRRDKRWPSCQDVLIWHWPHIKKLLLCYQWPNKQLHG